MIQLAQMNAEHVEQVAHLEMLCFSCPWSESAIRKELINPLSLWIVALDCNRVIGYVGSQTVLGEADMMNIAVDPKYRRKGIARKLINELVSRLNEKQAYCLTLEVRASNTAAINLYRQMNFMQVGLRPNYYSAPKEDALILRKEWQL